MTRHPYVRPTTVLVDVDAFRRNWQALRRKLPASTGILAIVKANAYGHGSVEITRLVQSLGAVGVGVADVSEAVVLRDAGYKGDVLCLGAIPESAVSEAIRHNLIVTMHDFESLTSFESISKGENKRIRVHLKIETGMHRLGLPQEDWPDASRRLSAAKFLNVEGIFTHLAESDAPDPGFTSHQIEVFDQAVPLFEEALRKKLVRHMANSGGALLHPKTHLDWVRPGIALYGYPPCASLDFTPALQWKTPILQVKKLLPGDTVSYDRTFTADRPMTVATIAVGYGDGYRRGYAPVGVGFRGRRTQIVGVVCMDLTVIDITSFAKVHPGEDVVLLGPPSSGAPCARELAQASGTIAYEVLTGISARVSRQLISEGNAL